MNEKHLDYLGMEEFGGCDKTREYIIYWRIRKFEVEIALKKTKLGKALGPYGIPIELWKCLGDLGVAWLTKLFNRILMTRKMPNGWRKRIQVPMYKYKGDV